MFHQRFTSRILTGVWFSNSKTVVWSEKRTFVSPIYWRFLDASLCLTCTETKLFIVVEDDKPAREKMQSRAKCIAKILHFFRHRTTFKNYTDIFNPDCFDIGLTRTRPIFSVLETQLKLCFYVRFRLSSIGILFPSRRNLGDFPVRSTALLWIYRESLLRIILRYYYVLCLRLRNIASFEASFCTIPSPGPANAASCKNADYNNIMLPERPEIKQNYSHFTYTCSAARDLQKKKNILRMVFKADW